MGLITKQNHPIWLKDSKGSVVDGGSYKVKRTVKHPIRGEGSIHWNAGFSSKSVAPAYRDVFQAVVTGTPATRRSVHTGITKKPSY